MKKMFMAGLIVLLPTLLMAQQVAVQNKQTTALQTTLSTAVPDGTAIAKSGKAIRKEERAGRQFARTTKAFSRDFENVSNAQWSTEKNAFVAMFTKDGVRHMVWYGKSGNQLCSMQTYGADKLPTLEQAVIRNEYRDYKITTVDEVHQGDAVVYLVHLENDTAIKLITVCDGATNTYRDYKKM